MHIFSSVFILILLLVSIIKSQPHFEPLDLSDLASTFSDYFLAEGSEMIDQQVKRMNEKFQNCEFNCPNKKKPKPKKGYVASYNGCGSYGINLDFGKINLPGFTICCNEHDVCYGTCNKSRNKCDVDFHKCLRNVCNEKEIRKYTSKQEICEETADMMFSMVKKFGCPTYGSSQKAACDCS